MENHKARFAFLFFANSSPSDLFARHVTYKGDTALQKGTMLSTTQIFLYSILECSISWESEVKIISFSLRSYICIMWTHGGVGPLACYHAMKILFLEIVLPPLNFFLWKLWI